MGTSGIGAGGKEQRGNEGDGRQEGFWPGWRYLVRSFLTYFVSFSVSSMILKPKIPQSQGYHQLADARTLFLGIPNTLNVISNVPFLVVGAVGLVLCYRANYFQFRLRGELYGWTIFFIGIAAVGIGSSYYHLQPNDATLFWYRLPMAVALTSIVAILVVERINENTGALSIIPLILAGIASILYWRFFDDLRPYDLVLVASCISIPIMAILRPAVYTHCTYWLWAAVFSLLAILGRVDDKVIYRWTHCIISGHTLEHLFAVMVPVFLTLMLAKRSVQPERKSLLEVWRVSWATVKGSIEARWRRQESTVKTPLLAMPPHYVVMRSGENQTSKQHS